MSPQLLPDAFVRALLSEPISERISRSKDDLEEYGRDWTRVHEARPGAIAFPRTTAEVSRLLELANAHGAPVVPSGGRTGLAGGAVATRGELVISLKHMNRMDAVDETGATVRVQAGAITAAVHAHTEPFGLTWPVDFASKGSSQIGGNIATNAGGVRVIRYGTTRPWVLGLEVVLANGTVLELNGALEKNNTGFDLRQLFIGSEGTLGIITEATLKLTRLPQKPRVFLFALANLQAVLALFRELRKTPFVLSAFEFFTDRCLTKVIEHRKLQNPFDTFHSTYALVEVDAMELDESKLDTWVSSLFERELVLDGVLAQHSGQARELWSLRESLGETMAAMGGAHKNDVSLPIKELDAFCIGLEALFEKSYPGFEVCVFGHIGDGNLHINVLRPEAMSPEEFSKRTRAADHDIFDLVQKHHGSISAEHGIGLLKKPYLSYSRTKEEIAVLRSIKTVLDPKNILNPGKIFD